MTKGLSANESAAIGKPEWLDWPSLTMSDDPELEKHSRRAWSVSGTDPPANPDSRSCSAHSVEAGG